MKLVRVVDVKPLSGYVVRVWFTDGTDREIDLEKYISEGPVFERIRNDPEAFRTVKVTEGRSIGWGEDLDICPDMLYYDLPLAGVEVEESQLALA